MLSHSSANLPYLVFWPVSTGSIEGHGQVQINEGSGGKRSNENRRQKYKMGLLNWLFRPKYKSVKELGIKPGWLRYKIYECLSAGKTEEQTYEELKERGEYDEDHQRSDALSYIKYFHDVMKGKR